MKPGGKLISTMLRSAEDVPAENVKVVSIYASPSSGTLDRVARHQDEKHTTVTVQWGLQPRTDPGGDRAVRRRHPRQARHFDRLIVSITQIGTAAAAACMPRGLGQVRTLLGSPATSATAP